MPEKLSKRPTLRDLFASDEAYERRNDPIPKERWDAILAEKTKVREEAEAKEAARIAKIKCPSCKSDKKERYEKRKDNGIIGPGYSSWIIEAYWICKKCGTHWTK